MLFCSKKGFIWVLRQFFHAASLISLVEEKIRKIKIKIIVQPIELLQLT